MIDLVAIPFKTTNQHGVPTTIFQCQWCGGFFSITPAPLMQNYEQWQGCLDEQCESYEPTRDASLYFGLGMVKRDDD